jgi:FkbM family methyltransferase
MRIDRVRGHTFVGDWIDTRSTVIDLGANQGVFSKEMNDRYGCNIVCVEANPALAARLHGRPYLRCSNYAIASQAGTLEFGIDEENPEASSLTRTASGSVQTVRVRGVPFADFLLEHGIGNIDLLKIDIEGAELDLLLESDEAVLSRVVQITVEFHIFLCEAHRPRVAAIFDRLHKLGFHGLSFSRNYEDTLFINTNVKPLSTLSRAALLTQKYERGGRRALRRLVGAEVA